MSKDPLGTDFYAQIMSWQTINVLTLTPTLTQPSPLSHSSVSGPLGVLKCVLQEVLGHTDSFGSLSMNVCQGAKNRIFSNGGGGGGVLAISFFTCFCFFCPFWSLSYLINPNRGTALINHKN